MALHFFHKKRLNVDASRSVIKVVVGVKLGALGGNIWGFGSACFLGRG